MNHNSAILSQENAGVLTMTDRSWRELEKLDPDQRVNVSIRMFF